jgi:hypothetical protein
MAKPFRGVINVDVTQSVPDWGPYTQPIAAEGTPSVLYIVLDDVGYSAMEAYGGLIETPNIDRIAQRGLTYTNFHTTALCSPTRSCLMTGRNHTTNGMATITEAASGFPSSNGHIPFECATIAEVLGERGWNTYMTGKWHLTAEDEMNIASRKAQWPVRRGFERFYGFLGAETNQWYPDLVYDNHPVEQPALPSEGYHLTVDLTDRALEFIRDAKAVAPDKPFFLYFCPGACHAPHHAPKEWIDKYRGTFDMGYEAYRELVFERQKRMEIITDKAELSPINPYISRTSADGKGWPEADTVRPWDSPPMPRNGCSRGWLRSTRASWPTPTTKSADCWTISSRAGSWTTPSSSWCRTTAPPARAARTARSTRTNTSTGCRTTSRPMCPILRTWAARRRTTTTQPGGHGPSTLRSSCGSGTRTSRAAPPTR